MQLSIYIYGVSTAHKHHLFVHLLIIYLHLFMSMHCLVCIGPTHSTAIEAGTVYVCVRAIDMRV